MTHRQHRCFGHLFRHAVALTAMFAGSASAASTAAADDAKAQAARADQLAQQGEALAEVGDLENARAKLAEAFALKPAYDIAGNLGGVEYGLGRYRAAAEHLAFSLRTYATTGDPTLRTQTEGFLKQARTRLCTLVFQVGPAGVALAVNDVDVGAAPMDHPYFVDPGDHTITATALGHVTTKQQVSCDAGGTAPVYIHLRPNAAGGGGGDGAMLSANGVPLWPAMVGGIIAAGGVGLGLGFWVTSQDRSNRADTALGRLRRTNDELYPCNASSIADNPDACSYVAKRREDEALYHDIGVFSVVTGGAAALATAAYLLGYSVSDGSDDGDGGVTARVRVTPGGVVLDGTF